MTGRDLDFKLSSLPTKELRELYYALNDRAKKLEATREIYGDASDEYSDASEDLMHLYNVARDVKAYICSLGDETLSTIYPDAEILYSGPKGLIRKTDNTNTPFVVLNNPLDKLGE